MKTCSILLLFAMLIILTPGSTVAQTAPVWTSNINALPDSTPVLPVKTLMDDSNHVFVLSTYMKTLSPGVYVYKIYLKKYSETGSLIWTWIYDNGGTGNPRGDDFVIDHSGNCYIAGGLMASTLAQPLLLKVNTGGNVVWQRDSTTAFNSSNFSQVFIFNSSIFVNAALGIARFDMNGTELWSQGIPAGTMAVDHAGQCIVSVFFGNPINIQRYDSMGVLNFSAVTINTKRIAVDSHNNFYLLTDNFPQYDLVKFDYAGNFVWSRNYYTSSGAFGDIGFDVLVDNNDDVILAGLNDSLLKVSPTGNLVWRKPMFGLDSYLLSAKITYNNLIAIAGSVPDSTGYSLSVTTFNLNGNPNWSGIYNGNLLGQEYTVSLAIDNSGIYAIENNNQYTTLVKFASPFFSSIDYHLICVDSVWYDPVLPNYIHVSVFNGNLSHLNYPYVQIVSPAGDTISNPQGLFNFFAQLGNTYQTYMDTITVTGITNFSNYTFLMNEWPGGTIGVIGWCGAVGVTELVNDEWSVYPNPVHDVLHISNNGFQHINYRIELFNLLGVKVISSDLAAIASGTLDVSGIAGGMYWIRISDSKNLFQIKLIKY
jgi:hypothetical protein